MLTVQRGDFENEWQSVENDFPGGRQRGLQPDVGGQGVLPQDGGEFTPGNGGGFPQGGMVPGNGGGFGGMGQVGFGGRYDTRFSGKGFNEIVTLSDTLNTAAADLGRVEGLRRELMANVSHDLRTPLALIYSYTEMMNRLPLRNNSRPDAAHHGRNPESGDTRQRHT